MTAKLTDRERWRRELPSAAPAGRCFGRPGFFTAFGPRGRACSGGRDSEARRTRRHSSTASIDPFTNRSNAALASAMIWRDRAAK
jgi:hypothetical protein